VRSQVAAGDRHGGVWRTLTLGREAGHTRRATAQRVRLLHAANESGHSRAKGSGSDLLSAGFDALGPCQMFCIFRGLVHIPDQTDVGLNSCLVHIDVSCI